MAHSAVLVNMSMNYKTPSVNYNEEDANVKFSTWWKILELLWLYFIQVYVINLSRPIQ